MRNSSADDEFIRDIYAWVFKMAAIIISEITEKLVLPTVILSYPKLEAIYKQGSYEVDYANRLERTDRNYYGSKAGIPTGFRMSTAGEELAIQLKYERVADILRNIDEELILGKNPAQVADILRSRAATKSDKEAISYVFGMESDAMQRNFEETNGVLIPDPRNAKIFADLFARGPDKIYMKQLTETFLRVPRGKQNPGKPDYVDLQGRKHWAREFGNGNEVSGVVYVPEGNDRVVPKTSDLLDVWDPITGVPRVTSDGSNDARYGNHTTHFSFDPTPDRDSTSGHYDVAVRRRCDWRHGVDGGCLDVAASYGRLNANSGGGFRPVRGSLPKIERIEK